MMYGGQDKDRTKGPGTGTGPRDRTRDRSEVAGVSNYGPTPTWCSRAPIGGFKRMTFSSTPHNGSRMRVQP